MTTFATRTRRVGATCAALLCLTAGLLLPGTAQAAKPCKSTCGHPSPSTVASSPPPSSVPPSSSSPPSSPSQAPDTQGSWVSPEGVTITVNSAGPWTIASVYAILRANALDLDTIGRYYTVNVQDQYSSQTQTSSSYTGGHYVGYKATTWLRGVSSSFAQRPDETLTHEYGAAWSHYWYFLAHNGSWTSYQQARWTTADGSMTLASDARTDTSSAWSTAEIVAEDYRLLFGSASAIDERPTPFNTDIPDPRTLPQLESFLLGSWRTP